MSRKKDYLQAIMKVYLEDVSHNEKINIDETIIDNLLSDNELSEGLEMIDKIINNISGEILPIVSLQYKIANISVGKPNTLKLELLNSPLSLSDKYIINSITGLEDIGGISWNIGKQSFEGVAKNAGTFQLEMEGVFEFSKGHTKKTKGSCSLTVIPDPKSLWKTLEPDETIPYGKDHEDSMCLEAPDGSRLLYASKRGRAHAHVGTFRDDDGKILTTASGWSILSIADGGGSYPLARRGAKIAVDKSIYALEKILSGDIGMELEAIFFRDKELGTDESKSALDSKLKETILSAAYTGFNGIVTEAANNNAEIKDYSTTLLIAAHKHTPHGRLILTFWVGDGVIALHSKGKKVTLLGVPDSGEFAGQTRFLDKSFFYDTSRVKIYLVNDFTALVLATDGVSDPYFKTDDALKSIEKWDEFWNLISDSVTHEELESARSELLEWLDFWSKGNHDDRTIALLLPSDQEYKVMHLDNQSNEEHKNKSDDKILKETPEKSIIDIDEEVDLVKVENVQSIQKDVINDESQSEHKNNVSDEEIISADITSSKKDGVNELEPSIDRKNINVELKDNNNNG